VNVPEQLPESPFSSGATEQLWLALVLYVGPWDEARHEVLQAALTRLCNEAHAANVGPERLLVVVKAAWAHVPGIVKIEREQAKRTFERVFDTCVETYYRGV